MTDRWQSDGVTLYCGDCLDVMQELEDGSIDAVVTDPPYGIGFNYASHDDNADGYGIWLWERINLAESKCRPGSPVFVWQAMPNVRRFVEWFPRAWRLFAACKNFVQMRPTAMQYAFDPVVVWWTEGKQWAAGTANKDYHIGNTANTRNRGLSEAYGHPCARPLNQVRHIINQWVCPEGTVLDCFMGSGTTGVACVQTGRRFIGIEIDPKYYAIAKERVQEAQMQPQLDLEPEPTAEQGALL